MKYEKVFDNVTKVLLIPLWVALLIEPVKNHFWILYIALGITTLLLLVYLILGIHKLRKIWDSNFKFQCKRMDKMILTTRKKIRQIIARTNNQAVLEYADERLREICPPKIYELFTENQYPKGQRQYNEELLQILKVQKGETNAS